MPINPEDVILRHGTPRSDGLGKYKRVVSFIERHARTNQWSFKFRTWTHDVADREEWLKHGFWLVHMIAATDKSGEALDKKPGVDRWARLDEPWSEVILSEKFGPKVIPTRGWIEDVDVLLDEKLGPWHPKEFYTKCDRDLDEVFELSDKPKEIDWD